MRDHIDGIVWHLDVGSSLPGGARASRVGLFTIKVVRELGLKRRETVWAYLPIVRIIRQVPH